MSEAEITTQLESAPVLGPGQILRSAREAAGMSLKEVAEKLRLNLAKLESIEKDDFSAIPEPIFIRGYLRSYAQLLKLAPEKVLQPFNILDKNQQQPVKTPIQSEIAWAKTSTYSKRGRNNFLISLIVVLAVLVSFGLWWDAYLHDQLLGAPAESDTVQELSVDAKKNESSTQEAQVLALPQVKSSVANEPVLTMDPASLVSGVKSSLSGQEIGVNENSIEIKVPSMDAFR